MRFPLDSPVHITQGYSVTHPANDLGAASGTPMFAPETGKVISVNNDPLAYFGGLFVVIMGSTGYRHYMGHNSKNFVTIGQVVAEGQHIANIGMTGFAIPSKGISAPTGPHTHWQVEKDGVTVDGSKLVTQAPKEVVMLEDAVRLDIQSVTGGKYLPGYDYEKEVAYWTGRNQLEFAKYLFALRRTYILAAYKQIDTLKAQLAAAGGTAQTKLDQIKAIVEG